MAYFCHMAGLFCAGIQAKWTFPSLSIVFTVCWMHSMIYRMDFFRVRNDYMVLRGLSHCLFYFNLNTFRKIVYRWTISSLKRLSIYSSWAFSSVPSYLAILDFAKISMHVFSILFAICIPVVQTKILWASTPVSNWSEIIREAYPVGNGRLGGISHYFENSKLDSDRSQLCHLVFLGRKK